MLDFLIANETVILWIAILSIVTFVGTLLLLPLLVAKIPADYFSNTRRHRPPWARHHPLVRAILLTGKNIAGGIFVCMGILMLVLPGQGLLTIAIGIMLLDFPGKFRFERWLASRGPVLRSINWLRKRAHRQPLIFDHLHDPHGTR
ncbi:MAG: PGPGW domain-containing protein [Thermodesulfobacteriota bacterium]